MRTTEFLLATPLYLAAFVAFYIASISWRRRQVRGALPFAVLMVGAGVWAFGYALELVSPALSHKLFYAKLQYVGILAVPGAFLSFAIAYTAAEGDSRWGRDRVWRLLVEPVATLALVWVYPAGRMVWTDVRLLDTALVPFAEFVPGPWYWVNVAYSYAALAAGSVLLVMAVRTSQRQHRRQTVAVLITVAAPWLFNLLYVVGLTPFSVLDLTPFGFVASGCAIALGLLRFQLLDIAPLVQRRVIEAFPEAYVVVDSAGRIAAFNPRALSLLGLDGDAILGHQATAVVPGLPSVAERSVGMQELHQDMIWDGTQLRPAQAVSDLRPGIVSGGASYVNVSISPLRSSAAAFVGNLVVITDITARIAAELDILADAAELERLVSDRTSELERINLQMREEINRRGAMQRDLAARVSELATLQELGQGVTTSLSVEQVAMKAVAAIRRAVGADTSVAYVREEQQLVYLAGDQTEGSDAVGHERTKPVGACLCGSAALRGQPVYSVDIHTDPRCGLSECQLAGLRSFAALPLVVGGEVLGVIGVGSRSQVDYGLQGAFLESLTVQAALGLRNALLYEESQKHLAELADENAERRLIEQRLSRQNLQLSTLNAVAAITSRELDTNRALETVLDEILALPGIDAVWLNTETAGREITLIPATATTLPEHIPELTVNYGYEMEMVVASQEPRTVAIDSTDVEPQGRHLILVPLNAREGVVGVLAALCVCRAWQLDLDGYVELLLSVGSQVALAMENLQLQSVASQVEVWEKVSRLRTDLVANVSHEIRTPLGLIKLLVTALQMQSARLSPDQQAEFLANIESEADLLESLVSDLLDVSRHDSGELSFAFEAMDLQRVVRDALAEMRPRMADRDLVEDHWDGAMVVWGDPNRLLQVIRNLLSNAIKYSPDTTPITVRTWLDGSYAVVSVEDQGVGIPFADQPQIFQRFYRADNRSTRIRGVGLGLSISKVIMETHGGRIWFDSTPGQGSVFHAALPLHDGADVGKTLEGSRG